jgi:hypothetical protein
MMGGQKKEKNYAWKLHIIQVSWGLAHIYVYDIFWIAADCTFGRCAGRALGNRIVDARGMSPRRRVRIGLVYRPPMREGSTER